MAILLANSVSVSRRYRLPVKPTRVHQPHVRPFGEGLVEEEKVESAPGQWTAIDQRPLPAIDGYGLEFDEFCRVNGARNRAMAEFGRSCSKASQSEIERVGNLAATDELRRTLRDRPAAPALKGVILTDAPCKSRLRVEPMGTTSPYRVSHTWDDETWESAWHIAWELGLAPVCGGEDGEPEMSDFDAWLLENEPQRDLSDDYHAAFIGEASL